MAQLPGSDEPPAEEPPAEEPDPAGAIRAVIEGIVAGLPSSPAP